MVTESKRCSVYGCRDRKQWRIWYGQIRYQAPLSKEYGFPVDVCGTHRKTWESPFYDQVKRVERI